MKIWLLAFACAFELILIGSSQAASYSLGGFTLGEPVRRNRNFGAYQCESGSPFPGITECSRTPQQNAGSASTAPDKVMHAEDGTAVYLIANAPPAPLTEDAIAAEIENLSNTFKDQPKKVERLPARPGLLSAVIVVWGEVELRQVRPEDFRGGREPVWPGIFLDPFGDMERSIKAGLPVYRVTGGPGYVYSASMMSAGQGQRRYEAVDMARPLTKKFEQELRPLLAKDRARARTDYTGWADVAALTRHLALDTSPSIAMKAQDRAFVGQPSQKLRSRVWAYLPLGTVNYLQGLEHSSKVSPYRERTEYPGIRQDMLDFLSSNPAEPFNEFLYYALGEYDKALQTNSNSIIAGVINYARGHELLQAMLEDVPPAVKKKMSDEAGNDAIGIDVGPVNSTLIALNWYPELYDRKLLVQVIPNFAQRAAAMRPYFEAALRDKSAPHADDAAYMLGWLAYQEGQSTQAINYLTQAMVVGNGDFRRPAAMRELVRILTQYPSSEQASIIASSPVLAPQPAFWYAAARSAYRNFDYASTIEIGERGLKSLRVPIERLPATTDPKKIMDALKKIFPPNRKRDSGTEDFDYTNAVEIPYVVEVSRRILRYQNYLKSASLAPSDVEKRAKDIIVEYSLLLDQPPQQPARSAPRAPVHKDLRQALNLVDMTFASVPPTAAYANLREWLYYRKVRILVQFDASSVPAAVSAMQAEFPKGDLMDDAMAEEIFAQGAELKDLNAAEATFRTLVSTFPNSNALDNGYTWMAIIYRCMGRLDDSQKMNAEILRRFPRTRHAALARERMARPEAKACGLSGFDRG